jgi:hypothetical protein
MSTNPKVIEALRAAMDAKRVTDLMDIEAHRTRQGHWHPRTVPCTRVCPAGDPSTRKVFLDMLRSV